MKKIIISAPFGNYLKTPDTTSTLGTFTIPKRAGFWLRLWRIASTVRYNWRAQAWINKLGLPNPGIAACPDAKDSILSVHGFNPIQWNELVKEAIRREALAVELNLSCPNIEHRFHMLNEMFHGIEEHLKEKKITFIAKLPPVRWMDLGRPLYKFGIRHFHLCNTIPTPGGGMSGKPLMQYSLWAIDDFRKEFGRDVTLIGGGGVTSAKDVKTYLDAGADHVSIGSGLFNPFTWRKRVKELTSQC